MLKTTDENLNSTIIRYLQSKKQHLLLLEKGLNSTIIRYLPDQNGQDYNMYLMFKFHDN